MQKFRASEVVTAVLLSRTEALKDDKKTGPGSRVPLQSLTPCSPGSQGPVLTLGGVTRTRQSFCERKGPWEIWSGAQAGPSRVLALELDGTWNRNLDSRHFCFKTSTMLIGMRRHIFLSKNMKWLLPFCHKFFFFFFEKIYSTPAR